MAASVAVSHGSMWPEARAPRLWQGPFTYEREFASRAAGCEVRGRESMEGVISCTGDDLQHLRCSAGGSASYSYSERVAAADGSAQRQRTDSGQYSGALSHYLNFERKQQYWLYDFGADANVPIHYQAVGRDGKTRNGSYLLDVGAGTDLAMFNPAGEEIVFDRSGPVTEPGPAACGDSTRNGRTHLSVRLKPVSSF